MTPEAVSPIGALTAGSRSTAAVSTGSRVSSEGTSFAEWLAQYRLGGLIPAPTADGAEQAATTATASSSVSQSAASKPTTATPAKTAAKTTATAVASASAKPETSSGAEKGNKAGAPPYASLFETIGQETGVDPALLAAVAQTESRFNPRAVSKAGASGLMQLMPATARSLGVKDVFDPQQNLKGGAKYLKRLLDRYHGDVSLALAGYNAGPGAVDRYGGIPPFAETKVYVPRVLAAYKRLEQTQWGKDPRPRVATMREWAIGWG